MKILVCLKQVPHQDARLEVNGGGTWIQDSNIKFDINDYDKYALERAITAVTGARARGAAGADDAVDCPSPIPEER